MHQPLIVNPLCHPTDVGTHSIEILLQLLTVAIVAIELPGHNLHSCTPTYTTATTWLPGCSVGDIAIGGLRTTNVAQPLIIKGLCIEIVHHRNAGHLTVARICRTLTVRAVARHAAVHIIELAALPYLVNLVNQLVRGLKFARLLDIRVHRVSLNLLGREVVDTTNLHLREYKPGETGVV